MVAVVVRASGRLAVRGMSLAPQDVGTAHARRQDETQRDAEVGRKPSGHGHPGNREHQG